jgi:peptide/nickel transport system permease protein
MNDPGSASEEAVALGQLPTPPSSEGPVAPDVEVALESLSQWRLAWIRFRRHRMAMLGIVVFGLIVLVAIFGPIINPYDPLNIPGAQTPGGDAPSWVHPFGTDDTGRDVFTMVMNGARISVAVGFISMMIAGFIGVVVGVVAGYVGGWVDNLLMRIVDVFFAVPFLFIILVAARFFGQGQVISLILIFGLLSWPLIARLIRALFLSLREQEFVQAATAAGVGDMRIAFRHIFPNTLGPVIVAMTLVMASNIVLEAFVSFLNFGISSDQTSWGNALSNAQPALGLGNWWWAFFPGMAIAITVISINFVGDGLRDALDPHSRG